ncbi:CDGSH iron-sulfur domain-containing protein [Streptomyces sp. NPDC002888]|uniref:CDGSH iron-sulfur domain-containing protein n=1 Tax=Streptomyces sp. NPDC002888 TaxID=3364668 RepID=UPI0036CAB998
MPRRNERPCRIRAERDGPLLVEGPVEIVGDDGEVVTSSRFTVAICTCRRSGIYPWCDTSHRRRRRGEGERTSAKDGTSSAKDGTSETKGAG